jgi:hypothetical protein
MIAKLELFNLHICSRNPVKSAISSFRNSEESSMFSIQKQHSPDNLGSPKETNPALIRPKSKCG